MKKLLVSSLFALAILVSVPAVADACPVGNVFNFFSGTSQDLQGMSDTTFYAYSLGCQYYVSQAIDALAAHIVALGYTPRSGLSGILCIGGFTIR